MAERKKKRAPKLDQQRERRKEKRGKKVFVGRGGRGRET